MSDRAHLLAAIAANYHEDTPRLAYADWLAEHGAGDLDRATEEFIRVSCDLHNSPFMPKHAYAWIEANWQRLVPSLLKGATEGAKRSHDWHREGRTIYVRVFLPYPLARAKSGLRPCPMRLDFHRGLLRQVTLWSAYALGYTAGAFAADQPNAILAAHCGVAGVYGRPFGAIMADPELREKVKRLCSFLGQPRPAQQESLL